MEGGINALTRWRIEKAKGTLSDAKSFISLKCIKYVLTEHTMPFSMQFRRQIVYIGLIPENIQA